MFHGDPPVPETIRKLTMSGPFIDGVGVGVDTTLMTSRFMKTDEVVPSGQIARRSTRTLPGLVHFKVRFVKFATELTAQAAVLDEFTKNLRSALETLSPVARRS